MFTVKIYERQADGSVIDTLFEVAQVRSVGDKITVDLEGGDQIQYERRPKEHEDDVDQKLYVMNRYGATVATYTL